MDKYDIETYKKENPFIILADVIYQKFREDIMKGKLLPGDRIVESRYAKELKVSRTPVNIAISRGLKDGWLERRSKRFLTVRKISSQECFYLYEARKFIEGHAAYAAAKRITKAELIELKNILMNFRKGNDEPIDDESFCKYDEKFHDLVVKSAHNDYLWSMYKQIKPDLQRYRYHYKQLIIERNTNENVYMYHYAIFLALKSRLAVVAKDEIESDISSMHGMVFAGNILARFNL
ncbi:GntR family transcriptional regulator [Megamonas hypermegale]|uniref:GntR family transcriptional regulator n=1 Tax=Megamonas hypermegale TaxID=158847 RepID=A0A921HNM5_9FIRM|nr:GntR family transcriptional regulator [Megamonas hypermegale]MDM8143797.1 GntR family transcriptional regulator [Megamonas hypermegale]HJF84595.1 GntR family transcriptional regulator [Megamonas hypermegale]